LKTKISWRDNTFQYSGTGQSKAGNAFFTCRFSDQSVFSLSSQKGILSMQVSDSLNNHYSFTREGNIICQSFVKQIGGKKHQEKKRLILSNVFNSH
jgi:hypothetical protein